MSLAACQKASNLVIDTTQPINAQLTYFDRDSVDVAQYLGSNSSPATLSDSFQVALSGSRDFKNLEVKVENDSGIVLNDEFFSNNVGDTLSGRITTVIQSVYVGDISFTFTAYNANGASGDYAEQYVTLYNSKAQPPVIESVTTPDSLQLDTSTVTVYFYAKVTDPLGLSDIMVVYFNTTLPNGTASSHNPYHMFDDGGASGDPTDGDKVAGDGTYTYEGEIPPNNPTGTYTFTFYAESHSGLLSAPVVRKIVLYK